MNAETDVAFARRRSYIALTIAGALYLCACSTVFGLEDGYFLEPASGGRAGNGGAEASGARDSGGTRADSGTGGAGSGGVPSNAGGGATSSGGHDAGGTAHSTSGGATSVDGSANAEAGVSDSGRAPVVEAGPDPIVDAPSCRGLTATCGASGNENCCSSPVVPGGRFLLGERTTPRRVSTYRLDKFEVTVGRFRKFVKAWVDGGYRPKAGDGKHTHLNEGKGLVELLGGFESGWNPGYLDAVPTELPYTTAGWDSRMTTGCSNAKAPTWTSSNAQQPANCISWYQAVAFCIWDGGFLPSHAEWQFAAGGGSEQRKYPWGSTDPGPNADLAAYGCYINNIYGTAAGCDGITNIAPVGSLPPGNGKFGHADLGGNVAEWVLDTLEYNDQITSPDSAATYSPDQDGGVRAIHGGSYSRNAYALQTFVRIGKRGTSTANDFTDVGFRCARSP